MYNYNKFKNREYDLIHTSGLKVGEKINDVELLNINNQTIKLSSLLTKPIVLETGSITCGMFAGQSKGMNELAKNNSEFNFVLLYVREAHPGKLISAHKTISDKCAFASQMINEDDIDNRQVLIDDIDGSFHNTLGALPNMVFIINTDGTILYKADWNNTIELQKALNVCKNSLTAIPQKWDMLPLPNIPIEYRIFKRAGWDAAFDFIFALPRLIVSHLIGGIRFKIFNK